MTIKTAFISIYFYNNSSSLAAAQPHPITWFITTGMLTLMLYCCVCCLRLHANTVTNLPILAILADRIHTPMMKGTSTRSKSTWNIEKLSPWPLGLWSPASWLPGSVLILASLAPSATPFLISGRTLSSAELDPEGGTILLSITYGCKRKGNLLIGHVSFTQQNKCKLTKCPSLQLQSVLA